MGDGLTVAEAGDLDVQGRESLERLYGLHRVGIEHAEDDPFAAGRAGCASPVISRRNSGL